MARLLVYRNNQGAAQAYLPPAPPVEPPQAAAIPGGPFPRASEQAGARGTDVSWDDWAQQLTEQLPYFDSWTLEDVPDDLTAAEALSLVRKRDAESLVSG